MARFVLGPAAVVAFIAAAPNQHSGARSNIKNTLTSGWERKGGRLVIEDGGAEGSQERRVNVSTDR